MSALAAALQKESRLVSRLLALLKSEQEILGRGSAEMLEALTREKNTLLEAIDQATHERETACGSRLSNHAAITDWLAAHPDDRAAAAAWGELITITRLAKEAHDKNGLMIDALIRKTGEALAILTQHQQEHSLYGRDGQTAGSPGKRIVDSA